LSGWRWLFITEGVPAIVLGFFTLFYLTDCPREARWLAKDEREWISGELEAETLAKKTTQEYTIWEAFRDRRVVLLLLPYLLANMGLTSLVFWLPTFIKRLSGLPDVSVTYLVMLPALVGLVGLLLNGWHSDKTGERKWHTAIPLACIGIAYLLLIFTSGNFPVAMILIAAGGGFAYAYYSTFWAMPTMILSESAAAATYGLINGMGHAGGFFGPFIIGSLSVTMHSFRPGFAFIGIVYSLAAFLVTRLTIRSAAAGHTEQT
jgi:ACS family tartrate transporter-like MFS transporter